MRGLIAVAVLCVACGGQSSSKNPPPDAATGGTGGTGVEGCNTAVTLRVTANVSGPAFCLGQPGTCDSTWLTLSNSSGNSIATSLGCSQTPCSTCEGTGCTNLCPISTRLPEAGLDWSWDGTIWVDGGTCGDGIACERAACAPAGQYIAHMCGYALSPGDDGGIMECETSAATTPTCVDVPFDVPGVVVANGVLGAP